MTLGQIKTENPNNVARVGSGELPEFWILSDTKNGSVPWKFTRQGEAKGDDTVYTPTQDNTQEGLAKASDLDKSAIPAKGTGDASAFGQAVNNLPGGDADPKADPKGAGSAAGGATGKRQGWMTVAEALAVLPSMADNTKANQVYIGEPKTKGAGGAAGGAGPVAGTEPSAEAWAELEGGQLSQRDLAELKKFLADMKYEKGAALAALEKDVNWDGIWTAEKTKDAIVKQWINKYLGAGSTASTAEMRAATGMGGIPQTAFQENNPGFGQQPIGLPPIGAATGALGMTPGGGTASAVSVPGATQKGGNNAEQQAANENSRAWDTVVPNRDAWQFTADYKYGKGPGGQIFEAVNGKLRPLSVEDTKTFNQTFTVMSDARVKTIKPRFAKLIAETRF